MAQKTIWMVSGNKGGVGKSLFCHAIASALEVRNESFAILDGDGRSADVYAAFLRKCPARSADFRDLRPESPNCRQDETYEAMVRQLLASSDNLIINTPDGADQILMRWFDRTLAHAEFSDSLFKFMYLLSDRPDGLDMLPALSERFSYLYPVRNLHFARNGTSEQLFTAFNRDYATMFNEVIEFPVLRGEETRMLFDLHTYPAEALRLKGGNGMYALPALSRARLSAWLYLIEDAIGNVVDNKTEPNIKYQAARQ